MCPLNYWFYYISKYEKTNTSDDKFQLAGIKVHERLDKLYKDLDDSMVDLPIMDRVVKLGNAFGESDTENPEANEIIDIARENYISWQIKMDKKIGKLYRPYAREKFVQFVLTPDFIDKFTEGRESANVKKIRNMPKLEVPILMRGYIDRVDFINDEYSIMDYKSKTSSVHAWELALYALGASINLKLPIKSVSCFGYKDGSYFYRPLKESNVDFALYKILEFNKNLKRCEEKGFKRKRGPFVCSWCEYQDLCNKIDIKETIRNDR